MEFENETQSNYFDVVDSVLGRELGQHSATRIRVQGALATALAIRNHDLFKELLAKYYASGGHDLADLLRENVTAMALVFPEQIEDNERLLYESLKTGSSRGFDVLVERGVLSPDDREAISVNVD